MGQEGAPGQFLWGALSSASPSRFLPRTPPRAQRTVGWGSLPASTVPAQVPVPVVEEGGWTEGKVGSVETLGVRSLDGPPRGSGHPSLPPEAQSPLSSWEGGQQLANHQEGDGWTAQDQLVTWPARFSKDLQGRRSAPGPGWAVVVPGRDPRLGSRPHPTWLVSSG